MNKQLMKKHYEATPKETLIEILVKSREEIERLKKRLQEAQLGYLAVEEKNKRLNNIINELEKTIEYEIEESKFEDDYERADNLDWCLYTIKLLKGEDKE